MSELSWWFSPHPGWEPTEDWPQEVPVVRLEAGDEVVLIDPFLPPDGGFGATATASVRRCSLVSLRLQREMLNLKIYRMPMFFSGPACTTREVV